MSPALAREHGRHEDRDRHLDGEHDRRDARRGPVLQRAHLAHDRDGGGEPGRDRPARGGEQLVGARRIGDEFRRQAAPGERGPGRQRGREGSATGAAAAEVRHEGERSEAAECDRERAGRVAVRSRLRGDGGEPGDAGDDRQHAGRVARADGLAERAGAEHEQQHEPAGERGLDDAERGQSQRGDLQRPAEEAECRARQPARAAKKEGGERHAQAGIGGRAAGLGGLQRDPRVVEDGRRARERGAEDDRAHGHPG